MPLSLTTKLSSLRVKKIREIAPSIQTFFETHKTFLEESYPGISLYRIQNEFRLYRGSEQSFFKELLAGRPLEYIIREAYFYKSEFYVDERVLIPRSETECLVERACQFISHFSGSKIKVCEVGVGSGAISLSCLCEINDKEIDLTATDICEEALEVFKVNHFRLGYKISKQHQVKVLKTDRLEKVAEQFNLILSNPPYIKSRADRDLVHSQVLKYEPEVALFLEDEDYEKWFEDFFIMIRDSLTPGGCFMMEGHENHLTDLKTMMDSQGWGNSTVLKDLTGTIRFLEVIKK